MNHINQFTKQYPVSKTLKFGLLPIGKTKEFMEKNQILSADIRRAESYKLMKQTLDEYHKDFIEEVLNYVVLEGLPEYLIFYLQPKEKRDSTAFDLLRSSLRKQIVEKFQSNEFKTRFQGLDKKELFKNDLEQWIKTKNRTELFFDQSFKNFTTYFKGYNENRLNLYTDKPQTTAIAYRLIHENLPKHAENIKIFNTYILENKGFDLAQVEIELESILQGLSLKEIFDINYFNRLLTQSGIDFINCIIGGYSEENGSKIRGLNEFINLFNQTQESKKARIPKLRQLYKQILSDRASISAKIHAFENDEEAYKAVYDFYQADLLNFDNEGKSNSLNVILELKKIISDIPDLNAQEIFIKNDSSLTDISQRIFGDYGWIGKALNHYYCFQIDPSFNHKIATAKSEKSLDNLKKQKDAFVKSPFISILAIDSAIASYQEYLKLNKADETKFVYSLTNYFTDYFYTTTEDGKKLSFEASIQSRFQCIQGWLIAGPPSERDLITNGERTHQLKQFLDSILELLHFVKPLALDKESILNSDSTFYGGFSQLFDQLNHLIPLYNKIRNYVTQKPYKIEKVKLNFNKPTLADGWDQNKESENLAIILRKSGKYYLGIMDSKYPKSMQNAPSKITEGQDCFEKMNYKLLPGPNKMLPKVFFAPSNVNTFQPSDEILEIRNHGSHSKSGKPQEGFEKRDFNKTDCHKLIDFFKESIQKHKDWKNFGFKFSPTENYEDISEFYKEVEGQGFTINFNKIPSSYIEQLIEEGKLYLFQLSSKDFKEKSKGTPNLHTLYWKAIFSEDNLKNIVYKLNGEAELFFRKASIPYERRVVHKANIPILSKNPNNEGKQNLFAYEIVKDHRFTVDSFHFHVPITMNFKADGPSLLNEEVRHVLRKPDGVKILGIDRGERNLLYVTLINQHGEIEQQFSLNEIDNSYTNPNGQQVKVLTPYHSLLENKEKERAAARVNWTAVEGIKELKAGFLSQAVHKIAKLMVEHNAILVMEDLNFGFKRGRFKVEKQVYQKFERMIIEKLNYLVFKNQTNPFAPGGILNAYQLTQEFESFKKMGKQSGFIFYVPAWNTSKICPITGFVNSLNPSYEGVSKAHDFFSRFIDIRYNPNQGWFEFEFDTKDFLGLTKGGRTNWTICSTTHQRFFWNRQLNLGKGGMEAIDVNKELMNLFKDFDLSVSLKNQVLSESRPEFFKQLMKLLAILLQLRYNNGLKGKEEQDYILSPVEPFFNSLDANPQLPLDADSNGAYHIAMKGKMLLDKIATTEDLKGLKLAISNEEWLSFITKRNGMK